MSYCFRERRASLSSKGARAHSRSAVPLPLAMDLEPLATWMGMVAHLRDMKSVVERRF